MSMAEDRAHEKHLAIDWEAHANVNHLLHQKLSPRWSHEQHRRIGDFGVGEPFLGKTNPHVRLARLHQTRIINQNSSCSWKNIEKLIIVP